MDDGRAPSAYMQEYTTGIDVEIALVTEVNCRDV
jgi:hypothetical protein